MINNFLNKKEYFKEIKLVVLIRITPDMWRYDIYQDEVARFSGSRASYENDKVKKQKAKEYAKEFLDKRAKRYKERYKIEFKYL